jgi:hypothetical protein
MTMKTMMRKVSAVLNVQYTLSQADLACSTDSASDSANGHDDKRQHPSNTKANATASGSGRKGGRKSVGEDGATSKGSSKDKAARRKEQNRAAQKAFRERREAKVSLVSCVDCMKKRIELTE